MFENLTWYSLRNPLSLAVFVMALMQLAGKGIIGRIPGLMKWLFKVDWTPSTETWAFMTNLSTWALCMIIVSFHIGEALSGGEAFVVSVIAALGATGIYEFGSNTGGLVAQVKRQVLGK